MVLPWLLVGVMCWLVFHLIQQNGRILLRLESIEGRLGQGVAAAPSKGAEEQSGLPIGAKAPEFELPDLAGKRRSLTEFRGRRLLLVFFGPRCGFCTQMVPSLVTLDGKGLMPLVITTGSAEENLPLFQNGKVRYPVLLQKQMEVASEYQAYGTPMGYLIDEQGAIASSMAVGSEALLALAGVEPSAAPAETNGQSAQTNGKRNRHRGNRPLHTSRLNRDGLKSGTNAPKFKLPRVEGGELALEQYRGRKVLLVFSDPQCGPCDEVAPKLEQAHRQTPELNIVMVSRRDSESNRKKVAELGLTFPVVLQKNWEVSMLYAMFATPIGYLIDEQGILLSDVAMGVGPILDLAARATGGTSEMAAGEGTGICAEAAKHGTAAAI
jgi:peroxiredoxin